MIRRIYRRKQFDKDLRRLQKRGKKISKLWDVVEMIQHGRPLEFRHRLHKLTGDWADHWDCHIEPDWLLLYLVTDTELILVRTGTHADLFE
jgi:mRNA interferase YafQ